jgi:hypothetical protein
LKSRVNQTIEETPDERVARLQREAQEGVGIDLEEEVPVSGLPPVEPTPRRNSATPEAAVAPVEPVVPVEGVLPLVTPEVVPKAENAVVEAEQKSEQESDTVKVFRGVAEAGALPTGGAFFTDSERDASAYAQLAALRKAIDDNPEIDDIVGEVMSEQGAEDLTDLSIQTVKDIIEGNNIQVGDISEGAVLRGNVRLGNVLNLESFGSEVGSLPETWNQLNELGLVAETWQSLDEDVQAELQDKYRGKAFYSLLEKEVNLNDQFAKGVDTIVFTDQNTEGKGTHRTYLTKAAEQFAQEAAPAAVEPTPVTPTPVTPEVPTVVEPPALAASGLTVTQETGTWNPITKQVQPLAPKNGGRNFRKIQDQNGNVFIDDGKSITVYTPQGASIELGRDTNNQPYVSVEGSRQQLGEFGGFEQGGQFFLNVRQAATKLKEKLGASAPQLVDNIVGVQPVGAPAPATEAVVETPALAPLRRVVKAEQTEEDVSGLVGQGLVELYKGQPVLTQAGLEALPEAERPRLTPEARKIQIDTRTSEATAEAISKNLRIGVDQVPFDVRMPAGWTIEGDIYIPPQPQVTKAEDEPVTPKTTKTKYTDEAVANLSLTERGRPSSRAIQVLEVIAKGNTPYAQLAQTILDAAKTNPEINFAIDITRFTRTMPDRDKGRLRGRSFYETMDRTIRMHPNQASDVRITLHEIIHAILVYKLPKEISSDNLRGKRYKKALDKAITDKTLPKPLRDIIRGYVLAAEKMGAAETLWGEGPLRGSRGGTINRSAIYKGVIGRAPNPTKAQREGGRMFEVEGMTTVKRVLKYLKENGITEVDVKRQDANRYDVVVAQSDLDKITIPKEEAGLHPSKRKLRGKGFDPSNGSLSWATMEKKPPVANDPDAVVEYGFEYGLGNIDEFLSEALSNPEFQKALNEIEMEGGKTVWQTIIDAIARILGMEVKAGSVLDVISRSAFELATEGDLLLAGGRTPTPAPQPEARESRRAIVTPQQDRDYLDAVERGDSGTDNLSVLLRASKAEDRPSVYQRWAERNPRTAETTQKAVEDTARRVGAIEVYHGGIMDWKIAETGVGDAVFFTEQKELAQRAADMRGNFGLRSGENRGVRKFFISKENILDATADDAAYQLALRNDPQYAKKMDEVPLPKMFTSPDWRYIEDRIGLPSIKEAGFDGVKMLEWKEGLYGNATGNPSTTYAIFYPNRIKSADPVTYDEAGNIIPPSQRFQQGEADIRYARTERDPEVQKAAQDLKAGTIDRDEYQRIVDMRMPIRKFEAVPTPANNQDMLRGLGERTIKRKDAAGNEVTIKKQDLVQAPESIAEGTVLESRLDIPAYENADVWVVSLHEPRPNINKGNAGPVVAYTPTSVLRNVEFGVTEKAAVGIAAGKPKSTIATMKGEYVPMTAEQAYELATTNKDQWVEIGMNPVRHSYFYDKDTQTPVESAEEVVQVGGMVLAKNPVFGKKEDYLYSLREAQPTVGMTTDAVRARLEALGFGVEGMIRIVEDPQAAFEGRTIIQDGKAVRIELNASALRDNAAIDRVLNHEFAEAANADGTLNKLVERLTPKEKKEINDAITRLGYEERVRTTEEAARAIEALAAGWKGRGFFERAVARVEAWGSKLGLKLTRRAAEYIAARNLSDINAGFKAAYNRFINVRGEAREGRAFVTPEENARFMELAKDPEANREELQKMVDDAAQAAGYTIDAYHGGTGLVGDAFDKAMRGANTGSPSSLKGFFFASNKRLSDWYATTSTGEAQFKELTEAYDKKSKNMRDLKSQMIEILRGKVEQNPNPDIAKLIIDGAAKWDDADSRAVVDSVFGAIPAIQELRARYDELANTDTFKLQEIMEASFREPERLMDLLENRGTTDKFKLSFKNPLIVDHRGKRGGASYTELIEQAEAAGNDGVIIRNTEDPLTSDIFIALEPEQIKSADAITRDNQGNIIPLDQRFQPATSDIRYSRTEIRESRREPAPTFTEESPEAKTLSNLKASMEKVDGASETKGGKPETQKVSEIAANWMEQGGDERALQDAITENTNLSPTNAAKVAKVIAKQYGLQQQIAETGAVIAEIAPEAEGAPRKSSVTKLIEQTAGVRKPVVKLQVSESAALKKQIQLKAREARETRKARKEAAEDLAKSITDYVKANPIRGPINSRQAMSITKKALKLDVNNEAAVDRFEMYVERVIENANYDRDLADARALIKKAKTLSKSSTTQANVKTVLDLVAAIPPALLDNPFEFNLVVQRYLLGLAPVTAKKYAVMPDADVTRYLQSLEPKIKENQDTLNRARAQRILDKQASYAEEEGIPLDEAIAILNSEEFLTQKTISKLNDLTNLLTSMAQESQKDVNSYDDSGATAKQKELISYMRKVGLDSLSNEEKKRYIRFSNNLMANGATFGMEQFQSIALGQEAAIEASKDKRLSDKMAAWITPFFGDKAKETARKIADKTQSESDTLKNIFGREAVGAIRKLLGLNRLDLQQTKSTKAKAEIADETGEYYKGLKKKYGEDATGFEAKGYAGVAGYLIQREGDKTQEESIAYRRRLFEQNIVELRKSDIQDDLTEADLKERALSQLTGASNSEILSQLKALNPASYEQLMWWKDTMLPKWRPFLKEHDENFNNQANNYNNPDHLTISYRFREGQLLPKEIEEAYSRDPIGMRIKQAANSIKRKEHQSLPVSPKSGVIANIDINFGYNQYSALVDQVDRAYVAPAWEQVVAFTNSPEFEPIMGGRANAAFVRKMLTDIQVARGRQSMTDDEAQMVAGGVRLARKMATQAVLGGFTQPLRQVGDQLWKLVTTSGRWDLIKKNLLSIGDGAPLMDKFPIGRRGDAQAGTQYASTYSELSRRVEAAVTDRNWAKYRELMNKVGEFWMTPLRASDVWVAKVSWMTYYEAYLNKQGIKMESWQREAELVETDSVRKDAAAQAEFAVDFYGGASDPTKMASLSKQSNNGWKEFAKLTFLPLNSFALQQKNALISDMRDAFLRTGDRKAAIAGIAGTLGGMAIFHGTRIALIGGLVYPAGKALLMGVFGIDMDEPDEEEKQKQLEDGWRKFKASMYGNIVAGGAGQFIENGMIDAFNRTAYLWQANINPDELLDEDGEIMSFGKYEKEVSPLYRFRSYGNSEYTFGLVDVLTEQAERSFVATQQIMDPEEMERYTGNEQAYALFSTGVQWAYFFRLMDTDVTRIAVGLKRDMDKGVEEREKEIKAIRSGR